ncbi:uncharacterized protein LOC130106414 [Rhinichthys klamathensis goyatoka]|uniref:uncharacterized protein LOC130106414 n=1 Tax=Rhinichthys klamathensis goyatoka TaxID=3034132 RepID=UPI0024B52DCA|nr:uncharacterized protein LOC130106414 [Rhinichthys klamathensis goyatoka]
MPPGSTPPHQPIGLAQAQTNNSNNKTDDTFTQQLQRLMDNWAEGVRDPSRSQSLSLRPRQLTRSRIWSAIEKQNIDIYSFHINSTVTSRYATTVITSRVKNPLKHSQEVHFEVKIPKNAFISRFRITIEGTTYDGVVKEKKEAQRQYCRAVSRGESSGLIRSVGRTLEYFKTSVTVAALSKVTFELTYEELLKRRLGKYELLINAQPMQPVADFKIDVHIHENQQISFMEVKGGLNTKDLANAVTTSRADKDAWVMFYPTRDQQTKCDDCSRNGLNGHLIIMYDVERPNQIGDLKASNGYFVHFFAPTNIQRIPKNVVFIIDQSGSMSGEKITQTRLAMLRILSDLAEDDLFGLITFSSHIKTWKPELLKATEGNVEEAKTFVKGITSGGMTDINAAVLKAVDMINSLRDAQKGTVSILTLLTDGDPTTGETNPVKIQKNVKKAIGGKFPLYSLGFGYDVSFKFLKKLSLENNGVALRIDTHDVNLKLQEFYKGVATSLLTGIHLKYQAVDKLTQTTFNRYYNGSEIVVAGHITDNSLESFNIEVIASTKITKVVYHTSVPIADLNSDRPEENNIERLLAFVTVKQLLEKEVLLNGLEKDNAKKEALKLSLKYKFVTPLTSMVVTKPQGQEMQVAHKPKEGEKPNTRDPVPMAPAPPRKDAPAIVLGDFNNCNLEKTLPGFQQVVKCGTRKESILDKCYINLLNAYQSRSKPPISNSDHNVVHLIPSPTYTSKLKSRKPENKVVRQWTDDSREELRACFDCTDWQQLVRVNNIYSPMVTTSCGAPQGCVSSPLLFTLYTNDCVTFAPNHHTIKFSDDTALVALMKEGEGADLYVQTVNNLFQRRPSVDSEGSRKGWCDNQSSVCSDLASGGVQSEYQAWELQERYVGVQHQGFAFSQIGQVSKGVEYPPECLPPWAIPTPLALPQTRPLSRVDNEDQYQNYLQDEAVVVLVVLLIIVAGLREMSLMISTLKSLFNKVASHFALLASVMVLMFVLFNNVTMLCGVCMKSIRILKSSGNAKPLCYDVPIQKVRLLQNDLSEFSMNGQLESGKGFSQIAIHYKTNHRLLLSTSEITYFDGQDTVKFSWDQDYTHHENEHVSLILQSNEMDVTMGNIRVVILLHKKDDVFLWPAIWQQPKNVGLTGILGKADIKYEEIPGSQTPTLKLKDKEVKTSWVKVRDYRLASAPVVGCWLVPFQVVAQRELSDFTVTRL